MLVPSMYTIADVMAETPYTEETVLDFGISGAIVFLVVVPEVGACRVPEVALSHFMAGTDDYAADKMPEHYSGTLSGPWKIKRERLRILADSWEKLSAELLAIATKLDGQHQYSIEEDGGTTTFVATPDLYAAMVAERKHQREARHKVGHYTMYEAAEVLQTVNGREAKAFLFERMVPAADAAVDSVRLRLIDPKDGGPVVGRACRPYQDWVTAPAIDEWLSAEGFAKHVRWPESAAISTAPDAIKPPEQTQPQPLPTNTIAQLFDGIAFTQDRWVKNIGQAKWLASANRGKGEQGGAPATWCPLTIAQLVHDHEKDTRAKQKTLTSLNSRFRTNPALKPWKDAWDDYYGMFTEPGEA